MFFQQLRTLETLAINLIYNRIIYTYIPQLMKNTYIGFSAYLSSCPSCLTLVPRNHLPNEPPIPKCLPQVLLWREYKLRQGL